MQAVLHLCVSPLPCDNTRMATNSDPQFNPGSPAGSLPAAVPASPVSAALPAILAALTGFRAGYKTSEFWLALFAALSPFALTLLDKLPAQTAAIFTGFAGLAYQIIRALAKSDHTDKAHAALMIVAEHTEATQPAVALPVAQTSESAVSRISNLPAPAAAPPSQPFGAAAAVLLACLLLAGCALSDATKAKWSATFSTLGQKAVTLAEKVVLNAALSQLDGSAKGDFLDSAASGLRTLDTSSLLTAQDIADVVKIWTPQKTHWAALAAQLAGTYAAAHPQSTAERQALVESLAHGLETVAAAQR